MNRRSFIRNLAGYGVASLAGRAAPLFAREVPAPSYFGLHPFIEAHPEAVFIRRTNLASKSDSAGKVRESLALARQIFVVRDASGVSLTNRFAIKPNLTSAKFSGTNHAIVTDSYVVEGFVEAMKLGGIAPANIYMREGLAASQEGTGFVELSRRSGAHYGDADSRAPVEKECPDGVVFRRTKYLGPFNYPDSYLINISKFKTHSMGLTLCTKNLQGTNVQPYIRFCGGIQNAIARDFQPDAQKHVEDLYEKHAREGMPRWQTEKGLWMEMWIQRTIDHYSLIRPTLGLNVIEGIYAQNGDGFNGGPGADGLPEIFMTNMLIFGKDAFRVDIIGHWLAGHEPGNFGLFHIGRERGVSTALNPRNIPVYLWEDRGPALTPLGTLPRTPLHSPYLAKSGESPFHLCDEPFAYPPEQATAALSGTDAPDLRVLGHARSIGGESSIVMEYNFPAGRHFSLDIHDAAGGRLDTLASGPKAGGVHVEGWSTRRRPSGTYYFRLTGAGVDVAKAFTLGDAR